MFWMMTQWYSTVSTVAPTVLSLGRAGDEKLPLADLSIHISDRCCFNNVILCWFETSTISIIVMLSNDLISEKSLFVDIGQRILVRAIAVYLRWSWQISTGIAWHCENISGRLHKYWWCGISQSHFHLYKVSPSLCISVSGYAVVAVLCLIFKCQVSCYSSWNRCNVNICVT